MGQREFQLQKVLVLVTALQRAVALEKERQVKELGSVEDLVLYLESELDWALGSGSVPLTESDLELVQQLEMVLGLGLAPESELQLELGLAPESESESE